MTESSNDRPESDRDEQKQTPRSVEFRNALNKSARLLRANRPGEAVAILEPLQKQYPTDPDVAINLGGALILQRKWNQAVKVLKAATQYTPDNVMLWINLAAAYLGRLETSGPKQQRQAIAAYERALQIDPDAPNVNYHLGLIYKEQGKLKRAAAHFQRALEVNPADKDARTWLDHLGRMMAEAQNQRDQTSSDADASDQDGPEETDAEGDEA